MLLLIMAQVLLSLIQGRSCLKFGGMDVPGAIISGQSLWLRCVFDSEPDELYSVKWYKNNEEFYRYLPRDNPPGQTFDLLGVYVDLKSSNDTHVFLPSTDLNTEGTIACEVSADAPSFKTYRFEKEMRVYVLPDRGPVIKGAGMPYDPGDEVNLTCTSGPAKPAPTLTWLLNGREAEKSRVYSQPTIRHSDGLQSSISHLSFVIEPEHLQGEQRGALKVQCSASVAQVYDKISEEIVVGDTTMPTPPSSGEKGPSINGGRPWYDVGQTVEVNCTSPKSENPVELQWFINEQEVKSKHLRKYPSIIHSDGTRSAVLGLSFKVQSYHMRNTELRLKCTASLSKIVRMSSEETVIGGSLRSSGLHGLSNGGPAPWSHPLKWTVSKLVSITWLINFFLQHLHK